MLSAINFPLGLIHLVASCTLRRTATTLELEDQDVQDVYPVVLRNIFSSSSKRRKNLFSASPSPPSPPSGPSSPSSSASTSSRVLMVRIMLHNYNCIFLFGNDISSSTPAGCSVQGLVLLFLAVCLFACDHFLGVVSFYGVEDHRCVNVGMQCMS